ncbi:MAG: UDP-glucose 6-dehydrogenase [Spirochaeta sp. LUC14_002_19_P3]|nr:MAG: UDP-glucose 6-dehydrogenase [Spirochaeta sp. LUC14_002_19_P3]
MMTHITVIGTGYVGLVTAVGLADFGHKVTGVDLDTSKISVLQKGKSPIYEKGIEECLQRNIKAGRLDFTADIADAVSRADVVFIAVGTPPRPDGSADLSQLESSMDCIADNARNNTIAVIKSTVPVGTNRRMQERIFKHNPAAKIELVSNPEFLREGRAMQDFFHPDRIVIGTDSQEARDVLEKLYSPLNLISVPFVWCNMETAELIKYASNAFLAAKVTFINQMSNLAEVVGADIHAVARAMGMDGRISSKFLHPGPGYGGSCFPKDTRALAAIGDAHGVNMSLIKTVIEANEQQKMRVLDQLKAMLGSLTDKNIAVLGLAFKSETDDIREAPSLTVVRELLRASARVTVHDPAAMDNFCKVIPNLTAASSSYMALENADALLILTDWNEYRSLDLRIIAEKMRGRVILDTRNVLNKSLIKEYNFIYRGSGYRLD